MIADLTAEVLAIPVDSLGDIANSDGHMMDGMLSEKELSELREAKGKEFDAHFLQG